ncbi:MAG: ATP-binding protein [Hyphomicrobiales bacterium]
MPKLSWFKQWLPKTLWGQLISLLMLALLVSQAVTLVVFINDRSNLSRGIAEEQLVSQVAKIINRFEKEFPIDRVSNEALQGASTNELRFRPVKTISKGIDDHPEYTEPLKVAILDQLVKQPINLLIVSKGANEKTFSSDNVPDDLLISVQLASRFWVEIKRKKQKFSYDWIWPLLMTMGIMMLFIIIIVSWVVKKITNPLAELANAAQELGRGRDVVRLEEMGAEDIRKVTRSFNDMNQKIKRFVNDRTKLLAAISHDLRTPITALLFRTEFIKDKEMQAKFFETLEEMQTMTEATLGFANDSQNKEKTKNIDLKSLLETVASDYNDMGKNVDLLFNSDNQQIIIPMRVQSIKRALRNFIDNGIKYGDAVKIEFQVKEHRQVAEIYIRDSGEGVAPEEFEQVFEPFYRLEKSRNKDTGGVGLGLSISRGIIRGHGGEVNLSNITEKNKIIGLEVKVTLPLK